MLAYIVTFFTYKDIFSDTCPSIKEVEDFFNTFHTPHLIQALCKLNIALWKEPVNIDTHEKIAKLFFNVNDLALIKKATQSNQQRNSFLFHRQQMLLAIKLALLRPNFNGIKEIELNKLGRCLLAISEYINITDNSLNIDLTETLKFESTRQSIAKLQYFSHYGDFMHNFARAIEMWLKIPTTGRGKNLLKQFKIDIYKEFNEVTGMTIEEYICINLINLFRLYKLDIKTEDPKDFMLFADLFSKTKLSKQMIEKLYKPLVQDIDNFKNNYDKTVSNYLKGMDKFESNFLPLIEYPIIRINKNMYIISDPEYLERRITEGPYWILLNYFAKKGELTKGRGRDLSSYFGILHQEYIYQSLTHLCDKVIEVPASNKEKLCDFIGIKYKNDEIYLFVIDAKKITLSLSMELNSDKDTTINNLKEIFFETGFRQIFNTIKKIQNLDLKELSQVDVNKIKNIFPILITDRFIAEDTLNRKFYENKFFEPLISEYNLKSQLQIAQPIFISAEEVDKIEAILQKYTTVTFTDIISMRNESLLKRYDREETNQFIPNMTIVGVYNLVNNLDNFWNFLFSIKPGVHKNKRLEVIFRGQMEKIKKILF